jgi:hypothetical protein
MVDWPATLRPSTATFWLEANTARAESPLTRNSQVIIRQGVRWRCDLSFDGRNQNIAGQLDGILAGLDGPGQQITLFDFRRPVPRGAASIPLLTKFTDGTLFTDGTEFQDLPYVAAAQGAGYDTLLVTGFAPLCHPMLMGDYFKAGNYLYMVTVDSNTDSSGTTTLQFKPRLREPIAAGVEVGVFYPRARFLLVDNQQGANRTQSRFANYTISFVESLP